MLSFKYFGCLSSPVIVTRAGLVLSQIKTTEGIRWLTVWIIQVQVTVPVNENPNHSSLCNNSISHILSNTTLSPSRSFLIPKSILLIFFLLPVPLFFRYIWDNQDTSSANVSNSLQLPSTQLWLISTGKRKYIYIGFRGEWSIWDTVSKRQYVLFKADILYSQSCRVHWSPP